VAIQQARKIQAAPGKVSSLLTSPAAWSLQPGRYAFDVTPATGTDRLRIVQGILRSGLVGSEVFRIGDEEPGQSLCLNNLSVPRTGPGVTAFSFSVFPARRGTKAVITVHSRANRSPMYAEVHHQAEPEAGGTRLTLTDRHYPATVDRPEPYEVDMIAMVSRYKSVIETGLVDRLTRRR
jgi:hypothetical protein